MSVFITGLGWVTPIGRDQASVFSAISSGKVPVVSLEKSPSGVEVPAYRVPDDLTSDAAAFPRLRRSSKISLFAVSAAIDAVQSAGLSTEQASRMGVVFAASNGGVIYTRRFFDSIIREGAGAGSPLLFPETVYNAPASHIAAYFKSDAPALSIVGDACASLDAISAGMELLAGGELEHCLVLGAEEIDGISADAYVRTGLLADGRTRDSLAVASEGAGAVVLSRTSGPVSYEISGGPILEVYENRNEIVPGLESLLGKLSSQRVPSLIVSSASGSPLDDCEGIAIRDIFADAPVIYPKRTLGESMTAATIMQVISACNWLLQAGQRDAFVTSVGFGGHVGALRLTRG